MNLIGANNSFLFFTNDSKHKNGKVSFKLSFYTWSMEYVKTVGQSNDPNIPFYFYFYPDKFVNLFGRYCFILVQKLRIVDEETGILLKAIEAHDFCFDNNYNIILSNKDSIQVLMVTC